MADTLMHSLPAMMARHPRMQFALLGRGDRELEQGFTALAAAFPGRASVRIGYAEACARQLHAGADLLLHGARFEPCGLVQQYALRYGTLPVVRRVGGLADSVIDAREHDPRRPNGFVFDEACPTHFEAAVERSVDTYEQRPDQWRALQDTAMSADWSWNRAADAYLEVYKAAVPWRHAAHAAPMPRLFSILASSMSIPTILLTSSFKQTCTQLPGLHPTSRTSLFLITKLYFLFNSINL
jgi:starch synthase